MSDVHESERLLRQYLEHLPVPPEEGRDARVLADALAAMRREKPRPELRLASRWRLPARLAAAGLATVALLLVLTHKFSRPAWALEQAIEALQKFKACNISLIVPGGEMFDCWARAEPSGELSAEIVMKGSSGSMVWVKQCRTYFFNPRLNRVEVDDAKTAGFSPWLGPQLFRMIARAGDARTVSGTDPATGRERVVMTGSMVTTIGPISWSVEFDRETKLPVSYTQWDNPHRRGEPSTLIVKIIYYRDLPDSVFSLTIPPHATTTPKPIVFPESNLDLLVDPADGMPVSGLAREEAAREILKRVYRASMAGDLAEIRRLCPLTRTWSDELMKSVIVPEDEGKRLAEVVDLGPLLREGSTRLGPYMVVPSRLKTRDGKLWDEKQIVLFRQLDGQESCVVYGPYGMICEVR